MKTSRLVTNAMLIALYVVMSLFVSIRLGNMKITLDALPILVGALLFGPADGFLIGLFGAFFAQLLTYGLTPTTILWVMPAAVRGLMVGFVAAKKHGVLSRRELLVLIVASSIVVTTLNTGVMAADALLYHYYSRAYVFGALAARYASGILTAILYAAVVPVLLHYLRAAGICARQ